MLFFGRLFVVALPILVAVSVSLTVGQGAFRGAHKSVAATAASGPVMHTAGLTWD